MAAGSGAGNETIPSRHIPPMSHGLGMYTMNFIMSHKGGENSVTFTNSTACMGAFIYI